MSKKTTVTETVVTNVVTAKRGRPVIAGCARQVKLAARDERVANGGSVERGRPNNPNSARQIRLAEAAARKANGIAIKVGRPKLVKVELVEELVEA